MKKYIFMAVAGMLALSSCSSDDNEQTTQNAPRQMTFTAGFGDGATTRATLDGSTKEVSFDPTDCISILSANNTNTEFVTDLGGAEATFTGTAVDDTKFYAIYPSFPSYYELTLSGDVISGIQIPSNQDKAALYGWDPAAPIAYATTTGSSLTFHNACALLKIENDWEDDVDISVVAFDDGTALTGTFDLDTNTGALTATMKNNRVTASDVPKGKTIYLAVAPFTTTEMFMAQGIDGSGDNVHRKMKTGGVTFLAGKIYDLGKVSEW